MIKDIQFETGEYGLKAVLTSDWSSEMKSYLLNKNIVEIELNAGKGWHGSDLSFLAELPHLQSLKILDLKVSSVDPIHYLHGLKELEIITYCKTEIRFSEFPQLEVCALEWRPKANSLFNCLSLKKLFVNSYKGKDASAFANLLNLESLAILNAPVENLQGLKALNKLRFLRLAGLKRLTSLDGIECLSNLEELEIHTCRSISSISQISNLKHLRKLYLSNDSNIDSLKPIVELEELESITFIESTNIVDGDLTPLLNKKKLSRVSFQNRRHYSHKREDLTMYGG
jgi:Leucine-rich repeat (LRR) protein